MLRCGFIQAYKNIKRNCEEAKKIILISHSPVVHIVIIVVLFSCKASAARQYHTLCRTKSGK